MDGTPRRRMPNVGSATPPIVPAGYFKRKHGGAGSVLPAVQHPRLTEQRRGSDHPAGLSHHPSSGDHTRGRVRQSALPQGLVSGLGRREVLQRPCGLDLRAERSGESLCSSAAGPSPSAPNHRDSRDTRRLRLPGPRRAPRRLRAPLVADLPRDGRLGHSGHETRWRGRLIACARQCRRCGHAGPGSIPRTGRQSATPTSAMSSRRPSSQCSRVSRQRNTSAGSPRRVSQSMPFGR